MTPKPQPKKKKYHANKYMILSFNHIYEDIQ